MLCVLQGIGGRSPCITDLYMKPHLVTEASKVIKDPQILINVVSRRVRQLNSGRQPLVDSTGDRLGIADLALMEIIQGKVTYDESIDPNA